MPFSAYLVHLVARRVHGSQNGFLAVAAKGHLLVGIGVHPLVANLLQQGIVWRNVNRLSVHNHRGRTGNASLCSASRVDALQLCGELGVLDAAKELVRVQARAGSALLYLILRWRIALLVAMDKAHVGGKLRLHVLSARLDGVPVALVVSVLASNRTLRIVKAGFGSIVTTTLFLPAREAPVAVVVRVAGALLLKIVGVPPREVLKVDVGAVEKGQRRVEVRGNELLAV